MPSNEYMREYMLARYHKRRRESIEKLGGKCVSCGSVDNLQLDHIDPDTKETTFRPGLSEERWQEELEKCQVLCKTCHEAKSGEEYSGEAHHDAKLTKEQVKIIRRRYVEEDTTYAELGNSFGVHSTTIGRIIRGTGWKHI